MEKAPKNKENFIKTFPVISVLQSNIKRMQVGEFQTFTQNIAQQLHLPVFLHVNGGNESNERKETHRQRTKY